MNDDEIVLLDDEEPAEATDSWVMLVVDDDPGVHQVTQLALRDVTYEGQGIEIVSAFSAREALAILSARTDVAVVLLDVVMETDSAGLDLIRTVRDELGNLDLRIILRTGQPGQAPEEKVIVDYDINDYRSKVELSRQRLFSSVVTALRSWRDIQMLHRYRREAFRFAERQQRMLDATMALLDDPVAMVDGTGVVVAANDAFAALAGIDPDVVVGAVASDLLGFGEVVAAVRNGQLAGDAVVARRRCSFRSGRVTSPPGEEAAIVVILSLL